MKKMTIEDKLGLNTFHTDEENSHIDVDLEFKDEAEIRKLLLACPAECYKYEDEIMYFNIRAGEMECSSCCRNKESLYGVLLDPKLLYIVRHIALTDFERLFAIKISPKYQQQLTEFTERIVRYYISDKIETLAFYRSL